MINYRGKTSDCVQDYGRRFNAIDGLGLLAEFAGIVPTTALGWVRGDNIPSGDALLRLRCFLHLLGYEVEEYVSLPKVTQRFAQLIALNVINVEQAAHHLHYQNTQDVYHFILRGRGVQPDRAHRIQRVVGEFELSRQEALQHWRPRLEELLPVEPHPVSIAEQPATEVFVPEVPQLEAPLAVILLADSLRAAILLKGSLVDESWLQMARELLCHQVDGQELEALIEWLD